MDRTPSQNNIFSQTRKGKQLSHDIWFSKSTFCSIDINSRKERIRVGIKSKICKYLVLVYDGRQSKGKFYL